MIYQKKIFFKNIPNYMHFKAQNAILLSQQVEYDSNEIFKGRKIFEEG